MTIYEELLKVAQGAGEFKPQQPDEDDPKYLKRLIHTVATVNDDVFYGMTNGTQKWFNKAAGAVNKKIPFDWNCPGFKLVNPLPPSTGVKTTGRLAVRRRGPGIIEAVRRQVILHPDWTSRQVHQYLQSNGFPDAKVETVIVNASDAHNMISIIKELGYWRDEEIKVQAGAASATSAGAGQTSA
jgi:hypothetical protein